MITIYIYGCLTCGTRATAVRIVQRYGLAHDIDVEIVDSKSSTALLKEHAKYQLQYGVPLDTYEAITVQELDDTVEIKALDHWL